MASGQINQLTKNQLPWAMYFASYANISVQMLLFEDARARTCGKVPALDGAEIISRFLKFMREISRDVGRCNAVYIYYIYSIYGYIHHGEAGFQLF